MAKMSFEEFLQARKEYNDYLVNKSEPEVMPKKEDRPAEPAEEPKQEEPAAEEAPADKMPANGPAEDYRKELNEIRSQLAIMARALSPSLGDIEPVGIDDVVSKFFNE